MRLLLRILLGLASLVLVAVLTVLLMAPQSAIRVLEALDDLSLVLRVAIVVVFYVVLLGVLYLRLRFRPRGHGADMLTVNTGGAVTAITVESVRERVLKAVRDIADVGNVIATLKSVRGRADIDLDVTMKSDEVNIPAKQREISRAIEQVIKKQLGLRMAGPARISIRLSEPKSPSVSVSPVTTSSPAVVSPPVTPAISSPPSSSPPSSSPPSSSPPSSSPPSSSPPPSTASQAPVVMPPVVAPVPAPITSASLSSPSTQPNMVTVTGADQVKPADSLQTTEHLPIPAYVKDRETAPTSLSSPVQTAASEESIPIPDFDIFGDHDDVGDDAGDNLRDNDDLGDDFDALMKTEDVSDEALDAASTADDASDNKNTPDF